MDNALRDNFNDFSTYEREMNVVGGSTLRDHLIACKRRQKTDRAFKMGANFYLLCREK